MAQQVKAPAARTDNLSSMPGTTWRKKRANSPQVGTLCYECPHMNTKKMLGGSQINTVRYTSESKCLLYIFMFISEVYVYILLLPGIYFKAKSSIHIINLGEFLHHMSEICL